MIRTIKMAGKTIEYELVQTARKSMELRTDGERAKVFAPRGVRLSLVDQFVQSRAEWLLATNEKLKAHRAQRARSKPRMTDGASILVEGQMLTLRIKPANKWGVEEMEDALWVYAKQSEEARIREHVRGYFIQRAKARIDERVDYYAPLIGRAPKHITIREQKTRWGSCSHLGNLNFNWKLIMAPPRILDYVVVHELCHLYELNHAKRFWDRVALYCDQYRECIKWLKNNGNLLGV